MEEIRLREKIDEMVDEIIRNVKSKVGSHIESITLTGSYATGKMALGRPNVNILLFLKPHPPANVYLETGRILFKIGKKYQEFFRFRIDVFPFRFAYPIGDKELEVSVNLNLYDMAERDLGIWATPTKRVRAPFGAPEVVIQSFKSMRKVVYGSDVLGSMEFHVTYEDILFGVLKEFPLYKLQLTRAPMTYDIDKDYELLATEAVQIGKSCLGTTAAVLLNEESIEQGTHLELLADKRKLLKFINKMGSPDLGRWAETVIRARDNFLSVKKDKAGVFEVYNAAYNILNVTFQMAMSKLFGAS